MRWEDERYVRLYTRDTATWKLLPWQGRALLPLLLRKADRIGLVDVEGDRVEGVAALVDLPPEVVEPGLTGLLSRGVVVEAPGGLAFPRYTEAQEARASDRLRAQDYRARKGITHRDAPSRTVTHHHDSSHGVTPRHPASPAVTPSLAEPSHPDCLPPGDAEDEPPHADKSDEQKPAEGRDAPQPATTPAGDLPKGTDEASSAPGGASTKGTEGGAGEQGALFPRPHADDRPRKARRGGASKAPSEMPFTIGEALRALAESSNGRFAPGEGRDITKGVAAQLTAHVKKYPTLEEWRVLGEWLAAGGWSNLDTLSPSWAAGNSFCGAMVLARDWHARGRPALDGHRQHGAPQVPATVPLSSSPYSAPKPLPEGVKSPSQIIRERQAAIAAARRAEVDRGTH